VHALYLVSVWLHVLAATLWLGGMLFLVVAVVPVLRRMERGSAAALMHSVGVRFRAAGWVCFALLLLTGAFNLAVRGVRWADLMRAEFWDSPLGRPLSVKLAAFALVLVLSAWHDFWVGPRATQVAHEDPTGPEAQGLRRRASRIGRANVLLALVLVACGVVIVRGWPF
jgi:copper resistance protein D